ncbi:MAG TPA: CARDB domain-containing protein [Thermoleophilaceae bacterium]|nr:CARDB domain-containing protein [Thermoleophilaceae bacterium]
MSRTSLIAVAALAALPILGMPAAAVPTESLPKQASSLASVRVAECARGPAAENRLAVFRGSMLRVPGSERMWMRFELQERVGDSSFRTVAAPGLGVWRKSRAGVRSFAYRQRVLALAEGAAYRTVVAFRWYGREGKLIRRAKRRSGPCTQPGPLANLRVRRIGDGSPLADAPGAYRYAVYVVNNGRVRADGFSVSVSVDGGAADTQVVSLLQPGEVRRVFFSGPPCQGTVTAVADSKDTVREAFEKDNSLTSPCPSAP